MNRLAYLSLTLVTALGACTGGERASSGQCPTGEVCSPATPNGLHFIGDIAADEVLGGLAAPAATAIGGTQEIALQYDRGDGVLIALDLPFTADDDGGLGVKTDSTHGSVVTLRGVASRTNYLRIVDPATAELYDRKEMTGAALDSLALVATDFESVPTDAQLAFAAGNVSVGVALFGKVQQGSAPVTERIVDHSMVISGAGGTQTKWDTLHVANAQVGTATLAVTAGDKPTANLDLVVVDHADAVQPQATTPANIPPSGSQQFCFEALAGTRFIVGLDWSYTVDGQTVATVAGQVLRNCISVTTTKTTGSVAIVARAGGQSASLTATVSSTAAARSVPFGHAGHGTTAGDRAAM